MTLSDTHVAAPTKGGPDLEIRPTRVLQVKAVDSTNSIALAKRISNSNMSKNVLCRECYRNRVVVYGSYLRTFLLPLQNYRVISQACGQVLLTDLAVPLPARAAANLAELTCNLGNIVELPNKS